MQMNLRNIALATSTVAGMALLSFGWSEQGGVSLSVESAQARIGRPGTPMSVAGVARRQNRRAYGYGAGVVGAGVGAAAVGTAAAVAATSPWNWGDTGYYNQGYYNQGYYGRRYGAGVLGAQAYYGGPVGDAGFYNRGYARPYGRAMAAQASFGAIETAPFYIPRAYYANGPWYFYSGWADYKARNGIGCDPGTTFKGADGLMQVCQ